MKSLFSLSLLLVGLTSFGQTVQTAKTLTGDHQLIPGTNISLVPPADFQVSSQLKGFQNPEDQTSMIMVVEIPGPFDQVSGGFNEEMMAARGMVLKSKEKLSVNDQEALFIEMEQDANGMTFTKSILIYGTASSSTLINGVSLKTEEALAQQIKKSVLSTFIDDEVTADPRAALDFMVDESASGLQFIAVMGNAMFFNRDGKTPTESEDKASLIIDRAFQEVTVSDPIAFCKKRLAMLPGNYELLSDEYPRKTTLVGNEAYELIAVDQEKDEELYMTLVFEAAGGYYIFVGMYRIGAKQAKQDIQAVMETFSRR